MTLGEFKKYTQNLDDSIELSYYYAGGNFPKGQIITDRKRMEVML